MGKRQRSEVWTYFTEVDGTPFAECIACQDRIKRGKDGDRSSWSATPLWNHLKRHHPTDFQIADQERVSTEKRVKLNAELTKKKSLSLYTHGTPKLADYVTRKEKYHTDSEEQKTLTKLLADWISDGVLPYSIVDNPRLVNILQSALLILISY